MRLLLVEDDRDLAAQLSAALSEEGFDVVHSGNGNEALDHALAADFDVIVLDLMLPGLDGRTFLRHLREERTTPVLILSARDALNDRVGGLADGADDYVIKPFELPELLARLRTLVRRQAGAATDRLVLGDMVLDLRRREVTLAGRPVELTPQEYRLLEILVLQDGTPISVTNLRQRLYGPDEEQQSNVVAVQIHHLRGKLGVDRIRTRRGFGYFLAHS